MVKIKTAILLAFAICATSEIFAQGILINNGAHFVMNGAVSMVVNNGAIKNNGAFAANKSTVKFTGNTDTASSLISGSSATEFYNLTVTKSNYKLASAKNTCSENSPVSSSGNLYINNYLILSNSINLKNKNSVGCDPKK